MTIISQLQTYHNELSNFTGFKNYYYSSVIIIIYL